MMKRRLDLFAVAERSNDYEPDIRIAAAAIISTEMEFRSTTYRFCEYLVAWTRLALGLRIDTMTLGIAQISIRHFRDHYGLTAKQALLESKSLRSSFLLCCKIISELPDKELKTIVLHYNGSATGFYAKRFFRTYSELSALLSERLQQRS